MNINITLFAALIASFLVQALYAQCPVVNTPNGDIDLNQLTDANDGAGFSMKDSAYTYAVRMCKNFDKVPSCVKSSAVSSYQASHDQQHCYYLGAFNGKTTVSLTDSMNPMKGVTIRYMDGETAFSEPRSTSVDIECDESDSNTFKCHPNGCEEVISGVRNYHFVLRSKAGCPSSGGRGLLWPLGILGLFFIFAMIGFALYWPIGIVINKFIRKKEGIEIIPNVAFWKDLPFLVKDGFLFLFKDIIYDKIIAKIVEKIRNRNGQVYESA